MTEKQLKSLGSVTLSCLILAGCSVDDRQTNVLSADGAPANQLGADTPAAGAGSGNQPSGMGSATPGAESALPASGPVMAGQGAGSPASPVSPLSAAVDAVGDVADGRREECRVIPFLDGAEIVVDQERGTAGPVRQHGDDVAVFLVSFSRAAAVAYTEIEDMMVAAGARGSGIGHQFMQWIAAESSQRGIKRLFLESGITNDHAHEFFEEIGFEKISVVMMKSLQ